MVRASGVGGGGGGGGERESSEDSSPRHSLPSSFKAGP